MKAIFFLLKLTISGVYILTENLGIPWGKVSWKPGAGEKFLPTESG